MPIHQIPSRIVKIDGTLPPFPAEIEITAELVPEELFGVRPLSGHLRTYPPGANVQPAPDVYHGGIRFASAGRLPKPSISTSFFDLELTLDGNIARVHGKLDTERSLPVAVHTVAAHLPGFLSCALGEPVDIKDLFGCVGTTFFRVEVKGTFESVISMTDPNRAIDTHLSELQAIPEASSARIFAAHRYVNQSLWLAYSARHPLEFAGERLLNLHKAVEILFPHGGEVNALRRQLEKLRVRPEVVELFASLAYMRNSIDVGHPKIAFMSEEEVSRFHRFVNYATELVLWLVRHVVSTGSGPPLTVMHGAVSMSSSIAKTLDQVSSLMDKVNPLNPDEFLIASPVSPGR